MADKIKRQENEEIGSNGSKFCLLFWMSLLMDAKRTVISDSTMS